ncbi:MAG: class I SAM-dependent rRNA methyltransferase [bacterium]|nr:class I SAM-dependent rRNA methyltransferase [bacterium]
MPPRNVTLRPKGLQWYMTGHAWIYREDVANTGGARSGDIVSVSDARGRRLGSAFYGGASKIALRLLTRGEAVADDRLLADRLAEAIERRRPSMEEGGAARLVYSEGDFLPGLVADIYDGYVVLQALIPAVDARLGLFANACADILRPRGIVCRNDASSRALEGLPLEKKMLAGEQPGPVEVAEGPVRYLADLWNGHKTGAYLDQRDNRPAAARYARGRVLDCFAYQGHFALHCARRAETVTAVESSAEAVAVIGRNCALNELANVEAVEGNAFDLLRRAHRERRRFDMIVLDPPPLARKRAHAADALRGYKEINLRAMHILAEGGVLATFCCSHGIPRDLFLEVLRRAAADARCGFRVMEELRQAADHPVLLHVPETAYLKGFVLRKT